LVSLNCTAKILFPYSLFTHFLKKGKRAASSCSEFLAEG
jgi:hypothetical protein